MIGPLLYDCNVSCEVVPINAPKLFGVPRNAVVHRYKVVSPTAAPDPHTIVPFAFIVRRSCASPLTYRLSASEVAVAQLVRNAPVVVSCATPERYKLVSVAAVFGPQLKVPPVLIIKYGLAADVESYMKNGQTVASHVIPRHVGKPPAPICNVLAPLRYNLQSAAVAPPGPHCIRPFTSTPQR